MATSWLPDYRRAAAPVASGAGLLAIVAVIGVVDFSTGQIISPALLYLIPVVGGAVHFGRPVGYLLALASGLSALCSDAVFAKEDAHRGSAAANALLMAIVLAIVVYLFERVRQHRDEARAAEERSRAFLAVAAHQVRSPLAGIRAGVDALVVGGPAGPDAEAVVAGLARDADRASRLVASMLRMARLDTGEPLGTGPVDLAELVHDQVAQAQARDRRGLCWRVSGPLGPVSAAADGRAVTEAVSNLLENAARHACGAVTVALAAPWPSPSGQVVEVRVSDDGPGLAADQVEVAFGRFVSLDGMGGSGLGLPIARAICEALGGDLRYETGGFTITLPAVLSTTAATGVRRLAADRSRTGGR